MANCKIVREELISEWRNLVRQWRTSRKQWSDPKQLQFEKEIWREFEQTVPRFLDKLGELNLIIEKARREIEDLSRR